MWGGFSVAFVESPADLFKAKLQTQYAGSSQYRGVFDCAKQIASKFGLRGVYQGLSATLVRNVPANAVYFTSYEFVRRNLGTNASLLCSTSTPLHSTPSPPPN